MKEIDITYKEVRLMRGLLIEELRSEMTSIGIEALKLVEMRLQTIIMAGTRWESVNQERKNFKKPS